MESKQDKIETLQIAIKHLIDDEKRSYKDVSITDRDKEIDHRLLSRLLSQLKALRDDLLQEDSVTKTCDDNERRTKDLREPDVVQPKKKKASVKKESSFVNEQVEYKMSNDNQAQDVSEGQSASQPPSSGNFNHSPQTPFIPITPMQFPQAGPFAQWLSNPLNLHFQNHQNPYAVFSGPNLSHNPPYYQQNYQSQPVFQTVQNSIPYQPVFQTPPPPSSGASSSGSKNWTLEEDLQLCRAWVKVIEDGKKKDKLWDDGTGGGQKKDKLWDRVRDMFHKLMNEVYGKESVRNSGGCENRMRDLKTQCSKWTEIRAKAYHQQTTSVSNLIDSESLARQTWEDENNGKPFRYMACWNVLKECPVRNDPVKKPSDKNLGSTSQPCAVAPPEPMDTPLPLPLPELSHPHTAFNKDKSHTPIMPITEEINTRGLIENHATCTSILNSPTSKDIEPPLGQKKKRKKQKLSHAQETASRTFRTGLTSFQADVNTRWEKSREDQRRRDDRNKRVLREEMRMQGQLHDLDLATKRSDIIDKITASGEKLILAIKKLDEIGADSVLTPNQNLQYEVRQKAVALHKKQYTELNESLERTEFQSPPCTNSVLDSPRAVGTSDEANNLEDD